MTFMVFQSYFSALHQSSLFPVLTKLYCDVLRHNKKHRDVHIEVVGGAYVDDKDEITYVVVEVQVSHTTKKGPVKKLASGGGPGSTEMAALSDILSLMYKMIAAPDFIERQAQVHASKSSGKEVVSADKSVEGVVKQSAVTGADPTGEDDGFVVVPVGEDIDQEVDDSEYCFL